MYAKQSHRIGVYQINTKTLFTTIKISFGLTVFRRLTDISPGSTAEHAADDMHRTRTTSESSDEDIVMQPTKRRNYPRDADTN